MRGTEQGTRGAPAALAAVRGGDRPRAHGGTSDAELAIFDATERLLVSRPFHELSVAEIIAGAGISRATFYFYFSSKYAVLSGLLARVMGDLFDLIQPFVERDPAMAPQSALRRSLAGSIELWARHRPALRAIHEHWNSTDELRGMWLGFAERFTEAVAREIDRERARGLASPGLDSHTLAATLLWSTEAILYLAGLGVVAHLPGEEETLPALMAVWTGALYGSPGH